MLEVFTIGGGSYLVNIFNAVAAWSGGGGFRSMIQVVMVMGLIYALCCMAMNLDWRALFNWFVQSTLVYMMLIVPTVSVKVTDRINPSLPAATIDNVPLGLGIMASFTSQAGDWMTRQAETVFAMPNTLNLSTNGMVYGARLLEQAQTLTITNSEFRANLDEHIKQCVFYDVLLGHNSMNQMVRSQDLWQAMGPGATNRGQKWVSPRTWGTSTTASPTGVITCAQAYERLSTDFAALADADLALFGRRLYPKASEAVALAKVKSDLPAVAAALHGSTFSGDAVTYLKQQTAIDAFRAARESFSSAGWDSFAAKRADVQAKNTYTSIATQAMTWVPLLHIVLTCVFYAMFIVVFPLFLLPRTGITTLKGYATGFFYLAAWGPLYAILHSFVMTRAANWIEASAPGRPTLLTFDSMTAVNNDIATVAGFLLMSVPFLAAGMARGAMAVAGQATSMLAPAQHAAEAAAVERTTGNYSFGNTSFANTSGNNFTANGYKSNPSFSSGYATSSFTDHGGYVHTTLSNGDVVHDGRGASSFLPNTINTRQQTMWALQNAYSEEQARHARLTEAQVGSTSVRRDRSNTVSDGLTVNGGNAWADGSRSGEEKAQFTQKVASSGTGVVEGQQGSTTYNSREGRNERSASTFTDAVTGGVTGTVSAGLGWEPNGKGGAEGDGGKGKGKGMLGSALDAFGIKPSVNGAVTGDLGRRWTDADLTEKSTDKGYDKVVSGGTSVAVNDHKDRTESGGNSATVTAGNYHDSHRFGNVTDSNSEVDSRSITFSSLEEKRSAIEASRERMERLATTMSKVQSNEVSIAGDITEPVAAAYTQYKAEHPNELLPDVWDRRVSPHEHALREQKLSQIAADYLKPSIEAHIAGPNMEKDMTLDVGPIPAPSPGGLRPPAELAGGVAGPSRPSAPDALGAGHGSGGGGTYDGRRDAAAHGMQVKDGAKIANLDGRMAPVIGAVAEVADRMGIPPRTITSGDDNRHKQGSRHYDGQGLDFRGNNISVAKGEELARRVQAELGSGYYVDFESDPKNPANNHLHVQTTGRR